MSVLISVGLYIKRGNHENGVLQYTNELNELPYFMMKYDQSCIVGQYNSFVQLKKESSASNDSS